MTFGTPHPQGKSTDVPIDANIGEVIRGFSVRGGEWIDAIKVITNVKQSAWYGDMTGGRTYQLTPPQGYEIIGIYGRFGVCCDGFGIVYTSNT